MIFRIRTHYNNEDKKNDKKALCYIKKQGEINWQEKQREQQPGEELDMKKKSRMEKFYYNVLIKGTKMFWIFLLAGILSAGMVLLHTEIDGTFLILLIWN